VFGASQYPPAAPGKESPQGTFESLDRPNALPLPQSHYEYAEWYKAKVQLNYHIDVAGHYYSVPFS